MAVCEHLVDYRKYSPMDDNFTRDFAEEACMYAI
jgi:hypothetical protein